MKFFAFTILLIATGMQAAPIPLGTSSALLNVRPGVYHSPLGFRIDTGSTGWTPIAAHTKSEFIMAAYVKEDSDEDVQAAFTVRVDQLAQPTDVESYAKKWLKDYPRLGFQVLTAKKVSVGDDIGFLLDLVNRDNKMQLRQLLFVKKTNVVNLTCRDQMKNFTRTLKDCNQIFRSFTW